MGRFYRRVATGTVAGRGFAALFAIACLLVALTFRDYGLGTDEYIYSIPNGDAILNFFFTLGKDRSSVEIYNFGLYGGLFDVAASLLARLLPFHFADARHLANALAGLLALAGCYYTAKLADSERSGFWAALFLLLCAPFYGHLFINSKDIPFAAGYVWSLYALLRFLRAEPAPGWREKLLLGLCVGATLGVRVGGVLLFLYLLLGILAGLLPWFSRDLPPGEAGRRCRERLIAALPSAALAWAVMIALWPAALLDPLGQPLKALAGFAKFDFSAWVLWGGQWLRSDHLPPTYLPALFAVELPEALLAVLVFALPWSFYAAARAARAGDRGHTLGLGPLLTAALFPPVYAATTGATLYDNMRHFLFVLPPLAIIAGMWWSRATTRVLRASRPAGYGLAAVLCALLGWQAWRMAALHPYEYTFKNVFAGGMPKAAEHYETDYWLTSYREAAAAMVDHARRVAAAEGVPFEQRRFSVAVNERAMNVQAFLPENFIAFLYVPPEMDAAPDPSPAAIAGVLVRAEPPTDYAIATTRWNLHLMSPDWPVLRAVGRGGMVFSVVKTSPALSTASL